MQIKSNWMIAVIIGFWQRVGFFYESILSFQASGCLRHHHWPFIDHYGNRDNLFVRCPFYAWLWRCWESTIPTFRLLLLTFPDLVMSCVVPFHSWLKSTLSCIGAFCKAVDIFCGRSTQAGRFLSFRPCANCLDKEWIQIWQLIFHIHQKTIWAQSELFML